MALQNNILVGLVDPIPYQGAGPQRQYFKFSVKLAVIVALGAFLTGDVFLMSLPPRSFLSASYVKHSVAVAGPSISACSAQLATATGNRSATAFDVFQAVSATAYDVGIPITVAATKEASFVANAPLFLHLIAVGANLSVATAGQIEVGVEVTTLP